MMRNEHDDTTATQANTAQDIARLAKAIPAFLELIASHGYEVGTKVVMDEDDGSGVWMLRAVCEQVNAPDRSQMSYIESVCDNNGAVEFWMDADGFACITDEDGWPLEEGIKVDIAG